MRRSRLWVALLALLAALCIPAVAIQAIPPIPYFPWGTVTTNGTLAQDGTLVEVWIGGVRYASATTLNGYYWVDVPGDDPDTPGIREGGSSGDTVVFTVNGVRANETGTWILGDNRQLDLTVNGPTEYWFNGYVYDDDRVGIPGVTVKLHRWTGAAWLEINSKITSDTGLFGLWARAETGKYAVEETNPEGYVSKSAWAPPGLAGTVIGPDRVEFNEPPFGLVGPSEFHDMRASTQTPTPTLTPPEPTATPTRVRPSATPTPDPPQPTATATPVSATPTTTATTLPLTPTPTGIPRCVNWQDSWRDDFEDPALLSWQTSWGGGSGLITDSILRLRSDGGNTDRFPLLWTQLPFPAEDYVLEIRFRYGVPSAYGTTIGVGSSAYDGARYHQNDPPPQGAEDVLRIHQLDSFFLVSLFGEVTWQGAPPDTAWHVVRVSREGHSYSLSVDGKLIGFADRVSGGPQTVLLGNPAIQDHYGEWTPLDIDYIRVLACTVWGIDRLRVPLLVKGPGA